MTTWQSPVVVTPRYGEVPAISCAATWDESTGQAALFVINRDPNHAHVRLAGDVSGSQSSTVVGALQGRTVASTAPTSGQILKFTGSQWAPGTDNDTTYSAGAGLSQTRSLR